MGYIDSIFDECKSFQVCAIMLKVPLFFLMRIAENQPDCFLKDIWKDGFFTHYVNRLQNEIFIKNTLFLFSFQCFVVDRILTTVALLRNNE
jgi:hypothetical protein